LLKLLNPSTANKFSSSGRYILPVMWVILLCKKLQIFTKNPVFVKVCKMLKLSAEIPWQTLGNGVTNISVGHPHNEL